MEASGVTRLLVIQLALSLLIAVAFGLTDFSTGGALAALYGGAITMINSCLLAWRVKRASQSEEGSGQLYLYFGALERFGVALGLLALGMGLLKLAPLPVLIGFGVTQLSFMINAASTRG